MGRPLNKKYFGYDNGIPPMGGEGVASVSVTNAGQYVGVLPAVSFNTPSFPGGQVAAATVHGKAVTSTYTGPDHAGTGYIPGNVLTLSGGTHTAAAQFTVVGIKAVGFTVNAAWDGVHGYADGDVLHYTTGNAVEVQVTVKRRSGDPINGTVIPGLGAPTGFVITQAGRRLGPPPSNPVAYNNVLGGQGASLSFTWGVESVSVTTPGDYTSVPGTPGTGVAVSGGSGTGATLLVRWGVASVSVTAAGDGYISTADAAPTFTTATGTGAVTATGTSTLTNTYANAIVAIDISTSAVVDIIKQENTTHFWVEGSSPIPYLIELASPAGSSGLYIQATDSSGHTYWIKKLTSHKATLGVVSGGGEFSEDAIVGWSFDAAVAGISVTVRNAI